MTSGAPDSSVSLTVATSPVDPEALTGLVHANTNSLRRIGESASNAPTKPGEWTSKELLGHLIDSALNNHQRVVRAQIRTHLDYEGVLRFPGYEQDRWVTAGAYADRQWSDLVDLWVAANLQLAHVARHFPQAALTVKLSIDNGEAIPIESALDYLDHLRHHLADFPEPAERALRHLPDVIVANGLRLRLPRPADAKAIIAAVQDPEIARWTTVPSPYGQAEAEAWLDRARTRYATSDLRREYLVFDGHQLVAMVGLVAVHEAYLHGEVGYWCASNARRKGVVSGALRGLLRAILVAGYQRISAEIIAGNQGSEAVLTKAGFTKEGRVRSCAARGVGVGAIRVDVDHFSLLPTDPAALELLGPLA